MGDVRLQRHQRLGNPEDLKAALENYEQALGLFRQTKNRSKEDEAKVLEATGDVHKLRYQLSGNRLDIEAAKENYQQAFGLFSDDTNARKRVKEKIEGQKQRDEPTGPLPSYNNLYQVPIYHHNQYPRVLVGPQLSPQPAIYDALPQSLPTRTRGSSLRTILLVGLTVIIVVISIGFLMIEV